jgi:hypothetical protein
MPANIDDVLLADLRVNSWIHPRLIHGAGGASKLNQPCSDESKITGVCVVRFTGAKYPRTRLATGAGAENQFAAIYSPCSW